jgi:hypothetical protein
MLSYFAVALTTEIPVGGGHCPVVVMSGHIPAINPNDDNGIIDRVRERSGWLLRVGGAGRLATRLVVPTVYGL